MKKIVILIIGLILGKIDLLNAQTPVIDSAKKEIFKINRLFDSSLYLGFDLDIQYKQDSSGITVSQDNASGSYVLNRKNIYYNIGGSEYVQTDSFAYTIYPNEKSMIMVKKSDEKNSENFPLQTFIDSTIAYYSDYFSISIRDISADSNQNVKRITFMSLPGISSPNKPPYRSFVIEYDGDSYYPQKFEFSYEGDPIESFTSTHSALATVTMRFTNYRINTNTKLFNDGSYVLFNRQRKIYEPTAQYKNYRFITSGFDNEDAEDQVGQSTNQ